MGSPSALRHKGQIHRRLPGRREQRRERAIVEHLPQTQCRILDVAAQFTQTCRRARQHRRQQYVQLPHLPRRGAHDRVDPRIGGVERHGARPLPCCDAGGGEGFDIGTCQSPQLALALAHSAGQSGHQDCAYGVDQAFAIDIQGHWSNVMTERTACAADLFHGRHAIGVDAPPGPAPPHHANAQPAGVPPNFGGERDGRRCGEPWGALVRARRRVEDGGAVTHAARHTMLVAQPHHGIAAVRSRGVTPTGRFQPHQATARRRNPNGAGGIGGMCGRQHSARDRRCRAATRAAGGVLC